MRIVTSIFGERYVRVGRGLIKSFAKHCPDHELIVYTDQLDIDGQYLDFKDLVLHSRKRVYCFKFELLRRELEHDNTVCWIDADTLVLGDFIPLLKPGVINVMKRTGTSTRWPVIPLFDGKQMISFGDQALSHLFTMTREGLRIIDTHITHNLDDMGIVNHLAHSKLVPVNWLDESKHVLGFSLCKGQPVGRHVKLRQINIVNGVLFQGTRRIILLAWLMQCWEGHVLRGFDRTFSSEVSNFLEQAYE